MSDAVTVDSWKTEAFGPTDGIPYSGEFPLWEFARLRLGLIPQAMEDKWFVYYEDEKLHFHRSWTGMAVYRVTFRREALMHHVVRAERCRLKDQSGEVVGYDSEYEAAMLDFLISNLLLGKRKPFPLPQDFEGSAAILQHSISGTGYLSKKL